MRRQLLATPSPYQAAECQSSLQFWTVLCPWQPQELLALRKEQQGREGNSCCIVSRQCYIYLCHLGHAKTTGNPQLSSQRELFYLPSKMSCLFLTPPSAGSTRFCWISTWLLSRACPAQLDWGQRWLAWDERWWDQSEWLLILKRLAWKSFSTCPVITAPLFLSLFMPCFCWATASFLYLEMHAWVTKLVRWFSLEVWLNCLPF